MLDSKVATGEIPLASQLVCRWNFVDPNQLQLSHSPCRLVSIIDSAFSHYVGMYSLSLHFNLKLILIIYSEDFLFLIIIINHSGSLIWPWRIFSSLFNHSNIFKQLWFSRFRARGEDMHRPSLLHFLYERYLEKQFQRTFEILLSFCVYGLWIKFHKGQCYRLVLFLLRAGVRPALAGQRCGCHELLGKTAEVEWKKIIWWEYFKLNYCILPVC